MIWNSWAAFWNMGGYALYVWGAFAVTAILIGGESALLVMRRRKAWLLVRRTAKYGKVERHEEAS